MNRIVLAVGGLVVVPLLFFLAVSFRFDPHVIESPLLGKQAPPFVLTDLEDRQVRSADLAGKPMVLNFWATWCVPCIAEHAVLAAAARRYEGRVAFLGVIYQDETDAIQTFLARRGRWGRTLVDPGGAVAVAYGVYGVPETFFVDKEGVVRYKVARALDPASLTAMVEDML